MKLPAMSAPWAGQEHEFRAHRLLELDALPAEALSACTVLASRVTHDALEAVKQCLVCCERIADERASTSSVSVCSSADAETQADGQSWMQQAQTQLSARAQTI